MVSRVNNFMSLISSAFNQLFYIFLSVIPDYTFDDQASSHYNPRNQLTILLLIIALIFATITAILSISVSFFQYKSPFDFARRHPVRTSTPVSDLRMQYV